MRNLRTGLIVGMTLSTLNVAEAAYVIKLKNGNEYVTGRFWQEGSQILFEAEGGVFGVDKEFVGKIEKTDRVIKLLTQAEHYPAEKTAATPIKRSDEGSNEAPLAAAKAPPKKDENDSVYKEASALKAQSDSLHAMARDELDDYVKRVVGLISKIQTDRKINQYLQEYSELNSLANSIEEEIKSRR